MIDIGAYQVTQDIGAVQTDATSSPEYTTYQKITIDHTKVSGTSHIDFPVVIDLADLARSDADLFDTCNSDGGDIRVTLSDGITQLAREIVSIDTTAKTGIMWVKIPTLASSADTEIQIWYNGSNTEPAASSTYGSENTWHSNYKLVMHMNQDPSGTAPQVLDSTSNGNDGTSSGSMISDDLVDAQVGKGIDFGYSPVQRLTITDDTSLDITGDLTVQSWASRRGYSGSGGLVSKYHDGYTGSYSLFVTSSSYPCFGVKGTGGYEEVVSTTNWLYGLDSFRKVTGVFVPSTSLTLYVDGVQDTQQTSSLPSDITSGDSDVWIGCDYTTSSPIAGIIDEVRILDTAISADWEATEYENQNSPSTFYSVAAESSLVEGVADFSGTIPELSLTADFDQERISMSGNIPELELSTSFGDFLNISGKLPLPVLTTAFGAQAGDLLIPVPEVSSKIVRNETVSLNGKLPIPVLSTLFASRADLLKLPIPQLTSTIERHETVSMSGKLPLPILQATVESNIIKVTGKLPDIKLQSLFNTVALCSLSGILPPPTITAICDLIVTCSMSGVLPDLRLTANTFRGGVSAEMVVPVPVMHTIASGTVSGVESTMSEHSRFDDILLHHERWPV